MHENTARKIIEEPGSITVPSWLMDEEGMFALL
jgi:hypothetical protein